MSAQPDSSASSSSAGETPRLTPASTPSLTAQPALPISGLRQQHSEPDMDDPKQDTVPPASGDRQDERDTATASSVAREEPFAKKTEEDGAQSQSGKKTKGTCATHRHQKQKPKRTRRSRKTRKSQSDESSGTADESDDSSSSSDSEDARRSKKKKKSKRAKKFRAPNRRRKWKPRDGESDSSDSTDDSSSSEEEEVSEDERKRTKKSRKGRQADGKTKRSQQTTQDCESNGDEDSDSETDSQDARSKARGKKTDKRKKPKDRRSGKAKHSTRDRGSYESEQASETEKEDEHERSKTKGRKTKKGGKAKGKKAKKGKRNQDDSASEKQPSPDDSGSETDRARKGKKTTSKRDKASKGGKKKSTTRKTTGRHYKRVDELWDSSIHNYKLRESKEEDESEFAEYAFLVRRMFNCENKYQDTVVDIKSKVLRDALAEVMKGCKSVSLETEEPAIDPNTLFLYLEDFRTYYRKTLKARMKAERKSKKAVKRLKQQKSLVKALVRYVDDDYDDTKKTLYPLLEAGNITFDLIWALFKPNELVVTSCYGEWSEPRCFTVEHTNKNASLTRGEYWTLEGKYLEYDGKTFGFGEVSADLKSFKGPRRISSLAAYPLRHHAEEKRVRKQIIERGEQFVNLHGMHYKFHKGLAFMKKRKQVLKISINGRVMLDPATFRRIQPNYPIATVKPSEDTESLDGGSDDDTDSDDCSTCGGDDGEANDLGAESRDRRPSGQSEPGEDDHRPRYKFTRTTDSRGRSVWAAVEVNADGDPVGRERLPTEDHQPLEDRRCFTEEELLTATPVMLGYAFSEKLWVEFSISGLSEIEWNEKAFESLVLPLNQKNIVQALVESHRFHSAKTIDDVVQGKGKGLVSVLHGPPGTGKTLTAEGISELLKCPLYMVSAGELGTDPAKLEYELQKILDIAHTWYAFLMPPPSARRNAAVTQTLTQWTPQGRHPPP